VRGLNPGAGTVTRRRAPAPDSASSDFFVCVTDTPSLDFAGARNSDGQGFAAFGRVVSGMDVIKKIQASPTRLDAAGHPSQTLAPRITITKVYRKK
jgi:peptidyl-prolyl cis-trans isomerase A (cyclophilin A)